MVAGVAGEVGDLAIMIVEMEHSHEGGTAITLLLLMVDLNAVGVVQCQAHATTIVELNTLLCTVQTFYTTVSGETGIVGSIAMEVTPLPFLKKWNPIKEEEMILH